MGYRVLRSVCFLKAFMVTLLAFQTAPADSNGNPSILVLCSYHEGHLWTGQELDGERKVILKAFPDAEIFVEFMDWKRFPTDGNVKRFRDNLIGKYHSNDFNLIVANDNTALNFAFHNRPDLFPGTPVIFAGINGFEEIASILPPGVTGVAEAIDPMATLTTALSIHPDTRRVIIITDRTVSGLNTRREIERVIKRLNRREISFEFADHLSMEGLRSLVGSLGSNSFVYMTYFNRDSTGTFYGHEESVELITRSSSVPVYHSYEFALGRGIAGGHLLSAYAHGESAGELAVKILQGADPDSIMPLRVSPCPAIFDFSVMKKYGILRKAVPSGAKLINRPESFLVRYRWIILAVALFSFFQTVVIAALLGNIFRRRRIERELKLSEKRFKELIERSPLAIFVSRDMEILYANDSMVRLSGYTTEELAGKNPVDLATPDSRPRIEEYNNRRLAGDDVPVSYEFEALHKDGRQAPIRVHVALVSMSEGPASVVFVDDLTEQKRIEQDKMDMLRRGEHAQKMESLGVLAGGIAHDFNNLLAGISANGGMARTTLEPNHEAHEYLAGLEKAVMRASRIARQLLTFARGGSPAKAVISIKDIVIDSAEFAFHGTYHNLKFDLPGNLWPVIADAGQTGQVINNLIINALQAMKETGIVKVSGKNTRLSRNNKAGLSAGTYVCVAVQDTGPGITPEDLGRIFDPFYTTKDTGTGLGLSTAYSIVKAHGGALLVDSKKGKGSRFSVYLPASPDGVIDTEPQSSATGNTRSARVLLMDDDQIVRKGVQQMLRSLGHHVDTASEGDGAIDLFRQAVKDKPYDFVILDLTVRGGKGGKETLEILKTIDPRIIAIATSGYSNDDVFADPAQAGFKASLPKPFALDHLAGVIAGILDTQ
ncbi:MAG: PAS domain S-box protein [Chitinivibrionales bacterium]|nr:PAS domain S-box protein [Chitinivibrionales bacterium]